MSDFKIVWIDHKREPQGAPDPAFPAGKDCDISHGMSPVCKTDIPYPAQRCGSYYIEFLLCGTSVAITTAGRPDDPRSITIPCDRGQVQ